VFVDVLKKIQQTA